METAGVNSERGFQRGLEKTVQSSISCCGRGPGVCATPGSTPGSPDPRDRALFTWMLRSVVGHHAGTAECPSLLVLGSEGSRALSQDSGHISDTPPPFPGLRTNLSGKTCAHQVPSKDPIPCSTAITVGQPVLRSESPSQSLIRGPAAVCTPISLPWCFCADGEELFVPGSTTAFHTPSASFPEC